MHIILGLPSAAYEDMLQDACRISQLDIQGIKFHVLHVLKGTALEKIYCEQKLKLLSQNDYVSIVADFLELMPPKMVALRLVSDAKADYLVAPDWVNHKPKVLADITGELKRRNSYQGRFYENSGCPGK